MLELMRNPKVMEKAQSEMRKVFDKKMFVDETQPKQCEYINLVIK